MRNRLLLGQENIGKVTEKGKDLDKLVRPAADLFKKGKERKDGRSQKNQ